MSPLELRTKIYQALNQHRGGEYGDILSIERPSPGKGEPLRLIVKAPDPRGLHRTLAITITEQCCTRPGGAGSECTGSLRDACTCMCH